ncbi:MAG: patatin-like phospholipase family protein [Nitrosomonadales bacterium]|nr:patatin-like phospholipase family protein [Nitrosomonadales bacterium]
MTASKNDKLDEVIEEEWDKEIKPGREAVRKIVGQDDADNSENESRNLVGLAFSGGGIRSATFNLGVIQALAERRCLRKFDYLSTVSGGGYIGSWLTSWMASHDQTDTGSTTASSPLAQSRLASIGNFFSRLWTTRNIKGAESKNIVDIEKALAPEDQNGNPTLAAGSKEPYPLRHLRSYTDYLKPHGGLFSLDAMTAFTTWLRNSLLNQLILLVIFAAVLLLPLGLAGFIKDWIYTPCTEELISFTENNALWIYASLCLAVAIGFINANLLYQPTVEHPKLPWYSSQNAVLLLIVLPLVACAFLLSVMLPVLHQLVECTEGIFNFIGIQIHDLSWELSPATMLLGMFFLCGIAFFISSPLRLILFKESNRRNSSVFVYGIVFIIAALLGVCLLPVIAVFLVSLAPTNYPAAVIANILTFGPPLILLAFALAVFVYVGLIGRVFDEHQREWWSRLMALVFFAAIGWLVLFGISIWGSLAVDYLKAGLASAIAWLVASGIGAALGKSASVTTVHESKGANKWLALAAHIAPYIFIFGLCLLVAYLLNTSLMNILGGADLSHTEFYNDEGNFATAYYIRLAQFDAIFRTPSWALLYAASGLVAIGTLLSWRVDINVFSFHNFYRNRLMRAYLAAGLDREMRDKSKLPLTGMNDMDSPRLDRLPSRPYHLLNTALNITNGKHLSWQERKAASFVFSKRYCGYFLPGETRENYYGRTENFLAKKGWLSLSLPMTISGAAASPNGGYHTSPPLAFLMTVFNVRLGWWMQNPAEEKYWLSKGPKLGLKYLFKELAASVDESSPFVYLSDGGHFENLGIYELVRRKCRLIVACDAGADPEYQFEDLGNAIRKCYIDLGVSIEIDTSQIKPRPEGEHKGRSPQHSAIGEIHYPDSDEIGILLYIKASMGDKEAMDIEHYKAAHPDFPHDPTANQFYTESQFESYRKLGYTLCHRSCDDAQKSTTDRFLKNFCS